MKELKIILLLFLFIMSDRLSGDIIIVNRGTADICVRIKNLDEYPNIAVIGLCDCVIGRLHKAYRVKSDSCLNIWGSCPLTLYAVKKGYIENMDLEKIDLEKDNHTIKSNLTIKSNTFYTTERIHTVEMDFNIAGFSDTSMVLYKKTQIIKYSNGRPDSVQYFSYKGDLSKLHKEIN